MTSSIFTVKFRNLLRRILKPVILDVVLREMRIWGPPERVSIAPGAYLANATLNTVGGRIVVGEWTFAGHDVLLITGTHPVDKRLRQRMQDVPREGRDILIGKGVWLGSNALILGPCTIGDHAVVAAGAVVRGDVPPATIVAGVPAVPVKTLGDSLCREET